MAQGLNHFIQHKPEEFVATASGSDTHNVSLRRKVKALFNKKTLSLYGFGITFRCAEYEPAP